MYIYGYSSLDRFKSHKALTAAYEVGLYQVQRQPLIRGKGNVWPLNGWIQGDFDKITRVSISINNQLFELNELFYAPYEIDNIDFFGATLSPNRWHFSHFIYSKDITPDLIAVEILIVTDANQLKLPLVELQVADVITDAPEDIPSAKIAVCMATYNPEARLFKRQLDSIIQQSESSWQLIINDDKSDPEYFSQILDLAKQDKRIHVFQNEQNLGFYYNFEICLQRIPRHFEFVALADQDDHWFKHKLETLHKNIGTNQQLYSDMHIADEEGGLISSTFWKHRSNHYYDLMALMLANTVTGSASIFRSNLLSTILPFPARLGNAFHDHWIALNAAMNNGLAYHDEVLQEYIQHDKNVTGYSHFTSAKIHHSTFTLLSLQRMKAAVALRTKGKKNRTFLENNLKVYFDAYLRRKLQYEILISRFPHARRSVLDNIFEQQDQALSELLSVHWKVFKNKWMTNNAELSYINAIQVMRQLSIKYKGSP